MCVLPSLLHYSLTFVVSCVLRLLYVDSHNTSVWT
jgi:hypothetical protein